MRVDNINSEKVGHLKRELVQQVRCRWRAGAVRAHGSKLHLAPALVPAQKPLPLFQMRLPACWMAPAYHTSGSMPGGRQTQHSPPPFLLTRFCLNTPHTHYKSWKCECSRHLLCKPQLQSLPTPASPPALTALLLIMLPLQLLTLQIAPMLDDASLSIEGIMPGGRPSAYTYPVDIYCFGTSRAVAATLTARLARVGLQLHAMTMAEATAAAAGRGGGGGSGGRAGSSQSSGGAGGVQTYLAPAQMENSLNRMFEGRQVAVREGVAGRV